VGSADNPDFIDVVDEAIDRKLCEALIDRFETHESQQQPGKTGAGIDAKKKHSRDITITNHDSWQDLVALLVPALYPHVEAYVRRHPHLLIGALSPTVVDPDSGKPVVLDGDNFERAGVPRLKALIAGMYRHGFINVQKYLSGEGGYPHWHSEVFPDKPRNESLHRVLFWLVYLNDVSEGGETEFFYYSQQVKPKRGRLLIAPTGFTHTHRGNVPRSGDKYILASWLMFQHAEQLYG
jgi:hypothetical protein